jgi:hypothetical protein
MQRLEKTIRAVSPSGEIRTIQFWRQVQTGGNSVQPAWEEGTFLDVRGENGKEYNVVGKGRYQDVVTQVIFSSDDPEAP